MIILGFPGIGKTYAAERSWRMIDLDEWYSKIDWNYESSPSLYTSLADHLNRQGYDVLIPLDEWNLKDLERARMNATIIFPSAELRDDWIERLRVRWEHSGSTKDYYICEWIRVHYKEMIDEIKQSQLKKLEIGTMDYDLYDIILHLRVEAAACRENSQR